VVRPHQNALKQAELQAANPLPRSGSRPTEAKNRDWGTVHVAARG